MQDVDQTIISQYANSPRIVALIESLNEALDPSEAIASFYDNVFNVLTAVGYGLDVWGRIVGVNRVVQIPNAQYLGWKEALPGSYPWNQGTWYPGAGSTSGYALADGAFRLLILAKALANISNGSCPVLNKILLTLFPGRGNCHVVDQGGMQMSYVFPFVLSPVELAVVTQTGVLPRMTGVNLTIASM